eukprot:364639-Chlamydomonas_euryale.AAC.21
MSSVFNIHKINHAEAITRMIIGMRHPPGRAVLSRMWIVAPWHQAQSSAFSSCVWQRFATERWLRMHAQQAPVLVTSARPPA